MSLDPYPSNEELLRKLAERKRPVGLTIDEMDQVGHGFSVAPKPKRVRRPAVERMNKTERAFSHYLEAQRRNGMIASWDYEAITFKLGEHCRYTPDFYVRELDDTLTFHETKGFMRDDALVKLRTFAKQYRFPIHVWKRKQGQWTSTDFTHSLSPIPEES